MVFPFIFVSSTYSSFFILLDTWLLVVRLSPNEEKRESSCIGEERQGSWLGSTSSGRPKLGLDDADSIAKHDSLASINEMVAPKDSTYEG